MLRAIKRIQTVQIQYLFKNGRRYHNRVGKHPVEDPRSIYDSKVQYLWLPSDWKQSQVESRNILKRTVWATLGISEGWFTTSPEAKELNELYIKYFYVPYWIMAAGVYSAIDHNTMHQEYPEGRLALDYTYSLSGTSHGALKMLQFPIPTTKPLDSNVLALPPLENCVYIPFSVPPPLHHREALMTLGSSMESQFTRNVRIRKGVKAKANTSSRENI
ncbi:hypothetical protein FRC18_000379 [Serendipita sp. 400]|nr:hypothetical protein FRC18_000379 [Serendipita sp. 400]